MTKTKVSMKEIRRTLRRHEALGKKIEASIRANARLHDKLERKAAVAKQAGNIRAMTTIHRQWAAMLKENKRLAERKAAWQEKAKTLLDKAHGTMTFGLVIEPRFDASIKQATPEG